MEVSTFLIIFIIGIMGYVLLWAYERYKEMHDSMLELARTQAALNRAKLEEMKESRKP